MSTTPFRDHALTALDFSHDRLLDLLRDFPEDQWFFQASPTDGHLTWQLGHLALIDQWFMDLIRPREVLVELPETYSDLFNYGSVIQSDPDAYPAPAEVREKFDAAHGTFVGLIEAMSEADMLDGAIGERSKGFVGDALALSLRKAWHDGWHAGQISTLRRALGLPSAFME